LGARNAVNQASGRVKYLYQPSDTLRLLIGTELSKSNGGTSSTNFNYPWGLGDIPGDPYDNVTKDGGLTGSIPGDSRDTRFLKFWGQMDWKTPIGTVTFIPSHNELKSKSYALSLQTNGVPNVYK
jgi:hypothetical protein